jgi:hypothetical protein
MSYSQSWGGTQPGCMIIMLDQSASMYDSFGPSKAGRGQKKSEMVATILNGFLNELINTNRVVHPDGSPEVRPRAEIAVIGYGSSVSSVLGGVLANKPFVTLTELDANPISINMVKKKEVDGMGNIIEVPTPFPIWVKAKAENGTPMLDALQLARSLAEQWASGHQSNYPPVIINITDGMALGDLAKAAQDIMQTQTNDGQALVFNVHITEHPLPEVTYPLTETELPNDQYARQLFAMSSVIPETSRSLLESQLGHPVPSGARGMIFNGDAVSVRLMFNFASAPAVFDPTK